MKSIVVYSSLTGNTKMVGETIAEVLAPNCDIYKVEDNPDITGYDLVVVGFWVDKGTADAIYQNLAFLDDEDPKYVLILSGDHIYKTTYITYLLYINNIICTC